MLGGVGAGGAPPATRLQPSITPVQRRISSVGPDSVQQIKISNPLANLLLASLITASLMCVECRPALYSFLTSYHGCTLTMGGGTTTGRGTTIFVGGVGTERPMQLLIYCIFLF